MGKNLFISYSRADLDYVKRLVAILRDTGFNIWFDANIRSGQHWDNTIQREITKADILIIILSNSSVASNNVMDEASYAISKDKTIIPVRIDNCEAPMRLARFQHIDLSSDFKAGVERLISDINYEKEQADQAFAKEKPVTANDKLPDDSNHKLKKILLLVIPVALVIAAAAWYIKDKGQAGKTKAEEVKEAAIETSAVPVTETPPEEESDQRGDNDTQNPGGGNHVKPGAHLNPGITNKALEPDNTMNAKPNKDQVISTNAKAITINDQIWTAKNVNLPNQLSVCYNDDCKNGRLYTLRGAALACQTLGDGWRLPTDADWQKLVRRYGANFDALTENGNSQFNATLSGKRIYNTDNFYFYDLRCVQ